MATASGTVFRSGGKERIAYATVKAYQAGKTEYTTANEAGEFNLTIPAAGTWEFVALDAGYFASKPQPADMAQDQPNLKIYLNRIAETEDEKAGKVFFWVLLAIFGLLIALYLAVHLLYVNPGKGLAITPGGFVIWATAPLRYLEILLWGLAGIVVSKIFTTGWYLRSRSFYREGILMHIAHIAATPVLVLVMVLLLSQVTLKLTLANSNEITIDLADPGLMIAFAFIIGTSPWQLWRFILNSARKFTGDLN